MRRVTTATADTDLFGTGKNGYTNGDAMSAIPPTACNADVFNNLQEEVSRAVEGNGATVVASGDTANYFQLDDAIQDTCDAFMPRTSEARFVVAGFGIHYTGLDVTLDPGRFVWDGRRYVITADKLAAAGVDAFTLTASRDTYFYLAPEDPGSPSTPPDRSTVYITTQEVAVGASAPATPSGTILLMRLTSDGSGFSAIKAYSHGPRVLDEYGDGFAVIREDASNAAIAPQGGLNIGRELMDEATAPDNSGYVGHVYAEHLHIRSTADASQDATALDEFTESFSLGAGETEEITIVDMSTLPDGACTYACAKGAMFDPSDPTDAYAFRIECICLIDGGTATLNSTGGTPSFEGGAGATAAGVGVAFSLYTTVLRLACTGHGTDATRWTVKLETITVGSS